MADIASVLGHPRLAVAALVPVGAAIGLTAFGGRIAHPAAMAIAPVVVAALCLYAALKIPKKPWDGRFGKLASILAFAASGLGLALVSGPWTAAFHDDAGVF